MPQSLSFLPTHIVFSTKDRRRLITPDFQDDLYGYLVGILRNHKCEPLQCGGVADHVHILTLLARTLAVSDLVRDLKANSSHWIHEDIGLGSFAWQRGYGAFSVGPSDVEWTKLYVATQEEHHRTRTFKEEFRSLLHEHGLEYDERYVWD